MLNLLGLKLPDLARFEAAQCKVPNPDATNFLDKETYALEHPVNLSISTCDKRHFVPRVVGVPQQAYRFHPSRAPIELNAGPQFANCFPRWPTAHFDLVDFDDLVLGCDDLVREVPVVRQEQQALGVVV